MAHFMDDVGLGHLVVPALFFGVEGHPNQTKIEDERRDDKADKSQDRLGETDVTFVVAGVCNA
jgi:hypothetical protein